MRMALDVSKTGIFDVDLATQRLSWSRYHELLFGFAEGEFDGTRESFRRRLHPEDLPRFLEAIERTKATREPYEVEVRVVWPDGSVRWVMARGCCVPDERGAPARIVGTVIETTERRRMEDALRDAVQSADAASRAKSAFLANVSHEVRTPLAAIIGFADLLAASGAQPAEPVARIQANARHLLQLIDDVLDLSRIEARKLPLEIREVVVKELVQDVTAAVSPAVMRKGLELAWSVEPDVPPVLRTDGLRLKQVLINIVGNAAKFTLRGVVRVRVTRQRERVAFSVRDSGIGISEAARGRLFEPFAQADDGTARNFGGSGLGLVVSRQLAQLLGGDLELTWSVPGEGSEFRITVAPQGRAVALAPPSPSLVEAVARARTDRPLEGRRILLVEDSQDLCFLTSHILCDAGATVDVATNGEEGVAKAEAHAPDLVLMDIQMPGIDGHEAARRLRRAGFARPIVALSAHAMKTEADRSRAAGCDAHLTKPIGPRERVESLVPLLAEGLDPKARAGSGCSPAGPADRRRPGSPPPL